MAVHPVHVDAYELMSLLSAKANLIVAHFQMSGHPLNVDVDGVAEAIKRMAELHLALKEAVAALPRPGASTGAVIDGQRA